MPQQCSKCSRANPPEAVYCHFDGFVLGGGERRGGPISVGSQPFNSPFVFPAGRTCRSFDELALACQEEWSAACGLLREGYLEGFLKGLGRVDLARAAKEAAAFPDAERGLDQLLEKIPSSVLSDPKLRVDPVEVSLGVLEDDKERTFQLELENAGGRLLYGTASSSDSAWISIGDAGATEKHFQFTDELKIKVHLRPGNVRASNKPIAAKILIESNGGLVPVLLKAEKPVKPFPSGPLKGAKAPRQIAELAMKAAKEVAPMFEDGAVERWYQSNGWIYPVKTPAASGLAAIQQFFEALGVTKPPKVEINQQEFILQADAGETVPLSVEVSTQDKKAVWAHATSNVPWLEVGKPRCSGRTATINMSIASVPDRPGETLEGELTVIGNGNARWIVPVRLEINGAAATAFDFSAPAPPPPPKPAPVEAIKAEPVRKPPPAPRPEPPPRRKQAGAPILSHLIPAGLLALCVLGVAGYDLLSGGRRDRGPVEPGADPKARTSWSWDPNRLRDAKPRIGVSFTDEQRFGIQMRNPEELDAPGVWKKLTFSPNGDTNNTVIKIGDSDGYVFGGVSGGARRTGRVPLEATEKDWKRIGWRSTADYGAEKIRVAQQVEIVPGRTGLLDTCLVYYRVHNYGTLDQKVGLRVMLDTYIGTNDGVPFTIPGEKGFVDKQRLLSGEQIPDYLEVTENPDDAADPGTTVRLGLRGLKLPGIEQVTEPDRVLISRYPGANARWEYDRMDMKNPGEKGGDSSVGIYWTEKELGANKVRHLAFTYGLGELDIGDRLALSVPASVLPGREFIVTCYVYNATEGQKVKLNLPEGLTLASGERAEKAVDKAAPRTTVFWRVRAARDGKFPISAASGSGRSRETQVLVKALGLFG